MSDNYSVTSDSINKFLETTAGAVNATSNYVCDIQKTVNGYLVDTVIDSNQSMSNAALRDKLINLQLQIDAIRGAIQEIQALCNMMRDILTKEHLLPSDWQKDAQPVTDDFKSLKGVL